MDQAPHRSAPEAGLNVVLELLGQATEGAIPVDLPSEPEKRFTLEDGINFDGVTRHTNGHEGPEFNPLVPFGPDGGFKGVVVRRLDGARRRLDIRARGTNAGGKRASMPRLDKHG